jgi:hypothetical protein
MALRKQKMDCFVAWLLATTGLAVQNIESAKFTGCERAGSGGSSGLELSGFASAKRPEG